MCFGLLDSLKLFSAGIVNVRCLGGSVSRTQDWRVHAATHCSLEQVFVLFDPSLLEGFSLAHFGGLFTDNALR